MKHLILLTTLLLFTLTACQHIPFVPSELDRRLAREYNMYKPHGRTSKNIYVNPPTWLSKADWHQFYATVDSVCDILEANLEFCKGFQWDNIRIWCHEHLEWMVGPYGFPPKMAGGQQGTQIFITWYPEKDAEGNHLRPAENNPLCVLAHEMLHVVFLMKRMYNPLDNIDIHKTLYKRKDISDAIALTKKDMLPIKLSKASFDAWKAYKYDPWRK